MHVSKYTLVVPPGHTIAQAMALGDSSPDFAYEIESGGQSHEKLEAYSGNRSVNNYGITVQGSGAWAQGHIEGSITAYDYRAIYKVFNLKDSESADYWFISYRKSSSHDELKKTNSTTTTTKMNYKLDFQIQGNDWGISSVFITYQVIRLVVNGLTKDYVVSNNASAGAMTPSGDKYPGGFKPVS